MRIQTNTTVATLQAVREARPSPLCLLELVGMRPNCEWGVQVSAIGEAASIQFRCDRFAQAWPLDLLVSGVMPELFSFSSIEFGYGGGLYRIDVRDQLEGDPSTTQISATQVGSVDGEWVRIQIDERASEMLSFRAAEQWLRRKTWAGTTVRERIPGVRLRVLSNEHVITPPIAPPTSAAASRQLFAGDENVRVDLYCKEGHRGVKIRHAVWGEAPGVTEDLASPDHLAFDVVVHSTRSTKVPIRMRAEAEYMLIKPELMKLLADEWGNSDWDEVRQRVSRRVAIEQVGALERRASRLDEDEFVYLNSNPSTPLIRVPANEQELVCLFMMLLQAEAVPFECAVLEYAAKAGIDAIGSFKLQKHVVGEKRVPIEFELMFESFLAHKHPVEQVKLIVCWSASGEELVGGSAQWLKYYQRDDFRIPVVLVSQFSRIRVSRLHGFSRDST